MSSLPRHCHPTAFERMRAALPAIHGADPDEAQQGLLAGAVAIATHNHPDLDPDAVEAEFERLADRIRDRLQSEDPRAVLAHAHAVLFEEEGFHGPDPEHYDEPDNSFVDVVLETKRGLPIVLVLIYSQVLRRVGVVVDGLDAPAHFLARVRLDPSHGGSSESGGLVVDPFEGGRPLSLDEARTKIGTLLGGRPSTARVLNLATPANWLLRMLRNLIASYSRRVGGGPDGKGGPVGRRLAAMAELQAILGAGPAPRGNDGGHRERGADA